MIDSLRFMSNWLNCFYHHSSIGYKLSLIDVITSFDPYIPSYLS